MLRVRTRRGRCPLGFDDGSTHGCLRQSALRKQGPNQLETLAKDRRSVFQFPAKLFANAAKVPAVRCAPVAQAPISFPLMGGERGIDFAERHEIDGCALDDAHRSAIPVQEDAQVAGLWKGRVDGRVLHGQAGRGPLPAGEDESRQFIRQLAFASKAKGIGYRRSPGIGQRQRLDELGPAGFALRWVHGHG